MTNNRGKRTRPLVTAALLLLPLGVTCQQTPKPQNPGTKTTSNGVLNLSFGPTASNPAGKAAAEKLLQAMGGAAKVDAVKTLKQNVTATQQGGQRIDVDQTIAYPDKQLQRVKAPDGNSLLVVTPTDAFMMKGGQVQDLPSAQRASLDATLKHDFINILQHINDPKYIFAATGHEPVKGADATVVDVEADGVPTTWWIGSDGKLLQERYSDMGPTGDIQTMTYSEWKDFGGLQYPTKYDMFNAAGEPQMSMTLTSMQVNPPVEPRIFQRPASNRETD
jgi:hypothetical protein